MLSFKNSKYSSSSGRGVKLFCVYFQRSFLFLLFFRLFHAYNFRKFLILFLLLFLQETQLVHNTHICTTTVGNRIVVCTLRCPCCSLYSLLLKENTIAKREIILSLFPFPQLKKTKRNIDEGRREQQQQQQQQQRQSYLLRRLRIVG